MDLGLVRPGTRMANEEVLSSDEMLASALQEWRAMECCQSETRRRAGVVMMDFHVDKYNNLSRRIITFLCIDSTNLIRLLHPARSNYQ
jgi:hypothetical protein